MFRLRGASLRSRRCLVAYALALFACIGLAGPLVASAAGKDSPIAPVFPYCSWNFESTPALANEAGPDPNATYWTMPFKTDPQYTSITIKGTYPEARFASFVVYNDGGDDFTETVNGKTVESAIPDYEIVPDRGSQNPWRVDSVPDGTSENFTIRLRRDATASSQQKRNVIPMVDTGSVEQQPVAASDIGFLTFRTYIPSGGNTTVKLPTVIINKKVGKVTRHITMPTCNAVRIAHAMRASKVLKKIASKVSGTPETTAVVTPCTVNGQPRYTNGCASPLEWIQSSSEQIGALFPNPSNAYISMSFYPSPGTVVVTRGLAASSPKSAGSGKLGDSIGAVPVNWMQSPLPYQVRYWSVNNYLVKEPYPVVTKGVGKNKTYGGTADYQTDINSQGQYTIVSSMPADKPSASALSSNSATWIAMQQDQPNVAETQWIRNMMGDFPYAIQNIPRAASDTDYVTSSAVQQAMGPYYPQSAQCAVQIFETQGADGCFANNKPATGPADGN